MKHINDVIAEELQRGDMQYKLSVWLRSKPEEQQLWDGACKKWNDMRQIDNDAVQRFIDGTDIRGFIGFMDSDVEGTTVHSDDFETVKKIIMNL